jgi:hypothetical protein
MKKLKLDLDRLEVESFGSEPARGEREGAVQAHQSGLETCYPCTDWDSCLGSCQASCWC